jgi:thioredoxin 1
MASDRLVEFTEQNFSDAALGSDKPVVVDFWAPWCGPCKMLTPILEELADEFEDSVVFGKVNVDDNAQIASQYNIISIPTLLFIKNGSVADQHVGLLAREPLKTKIQGFIAG